MESKEGQRNEYKEAIKDLKPENIVYIDESGVEERIVKNRG